MRAAVDPVRIIGQHLDLKKAGRTYKALCPFHAEKTPSFVVFPETGRWHCFGCGQGGDVFTFLMKIENLTFPEALRRLAEEAGIPITAASSSRVNREERDRLQAANEAAAVFYHSLLVKSDRARAYLASRGISDETTRRFLLGLSAEEEDTLKRHLLQAGFTELELLNAGLLYQGESGPPRDRYRGRLMFPIRDAKGKIVSFGARALRPDAQPKYLNGPQTELFDKGGVLYGLDLAAEAIKRERKAVVVEGYVDVVIAHQAGFQNVVAALGASITDRHIRELGRLAPEICLALDPDAAGEAAALRGAQVASEAGATVRIASLLGFERVSITIALLPEGRDPDEVILAEPELWRAAVRDARPVMDQALAWAERAFDVATLEGKRAAAEALVPLLAAVPDPITRAHYVEMTAQQLRIDGQALAERLAQLRRPARSGRPALGPTEPASTPGPDSLEVYALAVLVEAAQRGLPAPQFPADHFADPDLRALFLRLRELYAQVARDDWRPDLLSQVQEPWLEAAAAAVQAVRPSVGRLTDAEVASEAMRAALELTESQLARQLTELQLLAQDPELETAALRQHIARTARARADVAARARQLVQSPSIPWKYRVGEALNG